VSQHLKVLRDADLVLVRADGPRRLYAINTAGVHAAQ
jgi:DNA-binding transcriptional ArsR family regulator